MQSGHLCCSRALDLSHSCHTFLSCVSVTHLILSSYAQHIDGINLFGLISISSLLFCVPAAIWAESHLWSAAWQTAVNNLGPLPFYQLLAMSGLFYHLYNQVGGKV